MEITEIQLLTGNLELTRRFYQDLLGLERSYTEDGEISFSAGLSRLTFQEAPGDHPVYHFAFTIPNNQFGAALDWVGARVPLIRIPESGYIAEFTTWNARAFYFYDNNDNIVEMIARFDLDNSRPEAFTGASIYAVSEIGVVVEDPGLYAAYLREHYGLQFFSKQAPMRDFIAVGDDDGLLIIVSKDRKWYPTGTRSTVHRTQITIQLAAGPVEIVPGV